MRCEFSTAHKNSCGSVWNQAVGPAAHCYMPCHVNDGQFFETLLYEYTTQLNKKISKPVVRNGPDAGFSGGIQDLGLN